MYISLGQIAGGHIDHRTDIFILGAIPFEVFDSIATGVGRYCKQNAAEPEQETGWALFLLTDHISAM